MVAPSLIPTKAGDRVKTNRRDATMLARLHRAGELTPVWVPDTDHEAMRDLIRLRSVVRQIATRARQHLQGFLLRHGRKHGRGTAWRMAYRRWLSTLAFDHPAQQIAFQDYVDAVMDAERRLKRIEEQIFGLLPEWNLRPVVDALQAMRGIALINAVVLVAEVGDFTRFSTRASSWPISAWSQVSDRAVRPPDVGASPRPATRMSGARWSKVPGLTG